MPSLPPRILSAYRILRDLAMRPSDDFARGLFCMSSLELGRRLGIDPTSATRTLNTLAAAGVIKVEHKGEQRHKIAAMGLRRPAKATIWRWLQPLPEAPPEPEPNPGWKVGKDGRVIADQLDLPLSDENLDPVV